MMSRRSIMVLLVIFILMAIAVLIQNSQTTETVPQVIAVTSTPEITAIPTGMLLRVFPELAVLDIQAIRLEAPASGHTFTISRSVDGAWTTPDERTSLQDGDASAIARTLVLLPYARSINITLDTDFAAYGFEDGPRLLFQIIMRDGSGHAVAVGALAPDNATYFALVDERDELYLIERGPVDYLNGYVQSAPSS